MTLHRFHSQLVVRTNTGRRGVSLTVALLISCALQCQSNPIQSNEMPSRTNCAFSRACESSETIMNGCTPTGAQPYAEDDDEGIDGIPPALGSHLSPAFSGCFCSFVRSTYLSFFLLCLSVERLAARNRARTSQTKPNRLAFEETKKRRRPKTSLRSVRPCVSFRCKVFDYTLQVIYISS